MRRPLQRTAGVASAVLALSGAVPPLPALAAAEVASLGITLDAARSVTGETIRWTATARDEAQAPVVGAEVTVHLPDNAIVAATTTADGIATGTFVATEPGTISAYTDDARADTVLQLAPVLRLAAPARTAKVFEGVRVAVTETLDASVVLQRRKAGAEAWTNLYTEFGDPRMSVPLHAGGTGSWQFRAVSKAIDDANILSATSNTVTLKVSGAAPVPIKVLNAMRVKSGVRPVYWTSSYNANMMKHAKWMARNRTLCHCETKGTPGYSPDGDRIARSSLLSGGTGSITSTEIVRGLAAAPLHSVSLMAAPLRGVGVAVTKVKGFSAGGVFQADRAVRDGYRRAVTPWPGAGSTVPAAYRGARREQPNPFPLCGAGYSDRTSGLPVWASFGVPFMGAPVVGYPARVRKARLLENGRTPVTVCVLSTDRVKGNGDNATAVRLGLEAHEAVVLIPKRPLKAGASYQASITTQKETFTWTFRIGK
ncbi:CAP domain-containing protein [Actinoplanes sp. NPDC049802]|uniref:CAP domain-containing protein n=1 Tax=Actinoplanes sp. NPDC049802 TaxID=3154742 RepID=UPI003411896C